VFEDSRGRLWIGMHDGGVARYQDHALEVFTTAAGLPANGVYSVLEAPSGEIWLGTSKGICRFDGSISADDGRRIWFGDRLSSGWGYVEDGVATLMPPDGLPPGWIGALHVASDSSVWIGTGDDSRWEGICRFDGRSCERIAVVTGSIGALIQDSQGRLWAGTTAGVVCLEAGTSVTLTQAEGLPHQIVTAAAQTADGVLWFGTEGGGACCYDGQTVQVVEIPGGAALNVIHDILEDDQGRLWFATEGGLVCYRRQRQPPTVGIESVTADRSTPLTDEIRVPRSAARLGIRFRGRSGTAGPSQLLYRYRLEETQEDWQHTRENSVELDGLAPGEFRFSVQAVDPDLNYSETAAVTITVTEDPHVEALTSALAEAGEFFIGRSRAFLNILAELDRAAETDVTVLLLGETGTGKGMAARRIHSASPRQGRPFIHVNCGAMPEGLVESELFGHERGAFTGAVARRIGRFEMADGGTLFLDEVGDLPAGAQRSLLRVMEERVFCRVGGGREIHVDTRMLAATNRDLGAAMGDGRFREDLYYRLSAFTVRLPPLNQRPDDIPPLVQHFLERVAHELNRPTPQLAPGCMEILAAYSWPGNVRELEHVVRRAVLVCDHGTVRHRDLSGIGNAPSESKSRPQTLEEVERAHIEQALRTSRWVVYGAGGAAALLGVHPEKLRYRMRKYGIRRPS
jgi:DNA-binding NtrC family response regulator